MTRILLVFVGIGCLLFADDEVKQKVQVTHTQTVVLPSGGRLRFSNSIGELTVEGWDRPDVEITTIQSTTAEYASQDREKASRELDRVKVSVAPQGADLVVTTDYPRRRRLSPARLLGPAGGFDLEYYIKAPRNAGLTVDHATGEVHVYDMTADIRATVRNGLITLNLPQEGLYDIDAKSKIGEVVSEFPGHRERTRLFGHRFSQGTPAPHKLYLRVGFGDIIIFKLQQPPSGATAAPQAPGGAQAR
jgi:hypothetical protein